MLKIKDNGRKLLNRVDVLVIAVLIIIVFAVLFLFNKNSNQKNTVAVISLDGKIVKQIDLLRENDGIFNVNDDISFEIKNHMIRFIDVNCPDKLCENIGFISKTNEVAICLPNKAILKIIGESKNDDIDIIVK